jgi:hypothetical protein
MALSQAQSTFTLDDVQKAAQQILQTKPDPIPAYRLLHEVLRLPEGDHGLQKAQSSIEYSKWVKQLKDAQLPDGSWGRFHSQDTRVKSVFRTSEEAIDRAISLGLGPDHPALASAKNYIENVLVGHAQITDWNEKNDAWPVLIRIILAGKLAEIFPTSFALESSWLYMAEVAQQSFSSGEYRLADEINAHLQVSTIHVRRSFLESRYAISLLSARCLPDQLERKLVEWIWNKPDGMHYLGAPLSKPVPHRMAYWLKSMNILCHFPYWKEVSVMYLNELWEDRDENGWWDFGPPSEMCRDFPISENWRQPANRKIDFSTSILVVLRRYFD